MINYRGAVAAAPAAARNTNATTNNESDPFDRSIECMLEKLHDMSGGARAAGGEKTHSRCFNCHALGHISTDCLVPPQLLCYNCNQVGHKAPDCKLASVCRLCFLPGHKERHCPSHINVSTTPPAAENEKRRKSSGKGKKVAVAKLNTPPVPHLNEQEQAVMDWLHLDHVKETPTTTPPPPPPPPVRQATSHQNAEWCPDPWWSIMQASGRERTPNNGTPSARHASSHNLLEPASPENLRSASRYSPLQSPGSLMVDQETNEEVTLLTSLVNQAFLRNEVPVADEEATEEFVKKVYISSSGGALEDLGRPISSRPKVLSGTVTMGGDSGGLDTGVLSNSAPLLASPSTAQPYADSIGGLDSLSGSDGSGGQNRLNVPPSGRRSTSSQTEDFCGGLMACSREDSGRFLNRSTPEYSLNIFGDAEHDANSLGRRGATRAYSASIASIKHHRLAAESYVPPAAVCSSAVDRNEDPCYLSSEGSGAKEADNDMTRDLEGDDRSKRHLRFGQVEYYGSPNCQPVADAPRPFIGVVGSSPMTEEMPKGKSSNYALTPATGAQYRNTTGRLYRVPIEFSNPGVMTVAQGVNSTEIATSVAADLESRCAPNECKLMYIPALSVRGRALWLPNPIFLLGEGDPHEDEFEYSHTIRHDSFPDSDENGAAGGNRWGLAISHAGSDSAGPHDTDGSKYKSDQKRSCYLTPCASLSAGFPSPCLSAVSAPPCSQRF